MAEKSEAESTGSAPPAGGPHFLETEWVLWEHRAPDKSSKSYEDNMEKLVEFATVEDFWNAWNHIPPPSGIFYDGKTKKRFSNRIVESFSLFKKGIKPEWEDPANRAGAEWFCRRPFTPAQLDEFWLNLALGVIGETIDPADEICGARLVDKSSNARCMYRLELWFRKKDETIANDLLQRMQGALGKASAPLKW
eukprot:CAMPEP_0182818768 /NCGR_PEP_ID=MMETSP0006_2-20121128/12208_1 /TAXON_ID=97485 /ORGANISM="Prymnesium parvum, Strain Texoma1" /LENGTH=193 /DNA_ID=CAMNT_0024945271 /DNA_START=206 /DNA_END=784 /DNA_ORIENTATION=+